MLILFWLLPFIQAKQFQIDELLGKVDRSGGELERLREEKDQEIQILQEAMDSTIQQLHEVQQVSDYFWCRIFHSFISLFQTQGLSDEATTAQIDTLILDNRKKLNEIIGMFIWRTVLFWSKLTRHTDD